MESPEIVAKSKLDFNQVSRMAPAPLIRPQAHRAVRLAPGQSIYGAHVGHDAVSG
jgi:hypothetical protein